MTTQTPATATNTDRRARRRTLPAELEQVDRTGEERYEDDARAASRGRAELRRIRFSAKRAAVVLVAGTAWAVPGIGTPADAAPEGLRTIVDMRVLDDCTTHRGCAWTPDVGTPFILATGPSRAAAKIRHLHDFDQVNVTGDLAGAYYVRVGFRRDGDVYAEADGACDARRVTLYRA